MQWESEHGEFPSPVILCHVVDDTLSLHRMLKYKHGKSSAVAAFREDMHRCKSILH